MHSGIVDLPHELLERIFTLVSVEDVLSLSRTCKTFGEIGRQRSIWVEQLLNLGEDEVPDLPPHLDLASLPTTLLQSIAIKATRRRQLHTKAVESDSSFLPYERIDILPELPSNASATITPQLLPGGKHVLLESQGKVELWSVEDRQMIFRPPPENQSDYCATFTFDLIRTEVGLEAWFAVLFVRENASAYIRAFCYAFTTSMGMFVLQRNLASNFLWRPIMSGSLLVLHNASLLNVVLIDCETLEVTTIDFAPITQRRGNSRAALIGKEYLAVTLVVEGSYMLACIPIASLKERWTKDERHQSWPKLTFVDKRDDERKEDEVTGELLHLWEYNAQSSAWAVRAKAVIPTWRQHHLRPPSEEESDVLAEILIVKFAMADRSPISRLLIATHVQLCEMNPGSRNNPTPRRAAEKRCSKMRLLTQSTCEVEQIPWPCISITNSGRMFFSRDTGLFCCNLKSPLPSSTPPSHPFPAIDSHPEPKSVENDERLEPRQVANVLADLQNGGTVYDVEPWSETVLVGFPGRLSAMRLHIDSGELSDR